MSAFLSLIAGGIKFLGPVVVVAALIIGYYEGVPGIRDIPGITLVPVLREFVAGKVKTEADKAAREATEDLVSRSELTAARAEADALREQATRNAELADAARKQADSARVEAELARSDLEKKIAEDRDPDASRWTEHDLDRLRVNRGRP